MRRLTHIALAALTLVTTARLSPARAEGYLWSEYLARSTLLTASWEYGIPVLDLRSKFVSSNSVAGVNAGVRFGILPQLSAGIDATWNDFSGTRAGAEVRFRAISGRPTMHYYFTRSEIQPYVGLGVGVAYREAVLGGGPTQTYFGLCVDPQIGVLLTFTEGVALNVAARFELTTTSFVVNGDPALWEVTRPSWIGLQVGLATY